MKAIKQFEAKERVLGEHTFYIRPFPAFVSANISGELFSLITPLIGSIAPVAAKAASALENSNLLDMNAEDVAPILAQGLFGVSGEKLETLLKKLLCKHKNISVAEGSGDPQPLTEDMANEIFCGDAQDMFILAFDVIKVNYSGFFKKIGDRFGAQVADLQDLFQKKAMKQKNTAN